jgi:hypothetical protein
MVNETNIEAAFLDYVSGSGSLRTLAKKHDIPTSTILRHSQKGNWRVIKEEINDMFKHDLKTQMNLKLIQQLQDVLNTNCLDACSEIAVEIMDLCFDKLDMEKQRKLLHLLGAFVINSNLIRKESL